MLCGEKNKTKTKQDNAERKILTAQSIYIQPEYIGMGHCYYYLIGNLVILLCVIVYETL